MMKESIVLRKATIFTAYCHEETKGNFMGLLHICKPATGVLAILDHLIPSIHPGNGSFKILVMILGRMITTGRSPRRCPRIISPIALVNTYVFGHPNSLALQSIFAQCYARQDVRLVMLLIAEIFSSRSNIYGVDCDLTS
jgi:hypothetical protein